jgi:2-furoyl-CoA dehydrogenase large subunit
VEFDTSKDAWSVAAGNYSSRFAGAVAGTLHLACERLRAKVARIAAAHFGSTPEAIAFAGSKIYPISEPERATPFGRFAASPHWAPALLPEGESVGLRETAFWTSPQLSAPDDDDRVNTSAAYGFAFDICALEVDRATGRLHIEKYVTIHDAGKILHPGMADGQIRGAFAQGLGAAIMEEFRYGADGSFQSGTFADYLVPTTCEVPDPVILHLETPSPFTPLGAKGLGEGNNMSTPVCVANAVADALGRSDIQLPLTPTRVMAMLGIEDPPPSKPMADLPPASTAGGQGGKGLAAQGEVELSAPPEAVFAVMMDPAALAKVIPGCSSLDQVGQNRYRADVTVGIGLIKARYAAEIALSDIEAPHRLRLAGSGLSSMGAAKGSGLVTLTPHEGGTLLSYDYQAEVSGKVAAVGGRMLEGAAKIVLKQLFEQLGRQAGGQGGGASGSRWRRLIARMRGSK